MLQKQQYQKDYHDRRAQSRILDVRDCVYVLNFSRGPRWLPGVIQAKTGPVSFKIVLDDGRIMRRHQDHLRLRYDKDDGNLDVHDEDYRSPPADSQSPAEPAPTSMSSVLPQELPKPQVTAPPRPVHTPSVPAAPPPETGPQQTPARPFVPRQSTRVTKGKAPDRLGFYS